ncbi:MAG: TIGR03915 family putative DNA repair protein [Janthinobacterium lividum]
MTGQGQVPDQSALHGQIESPVVESFADWRSAARLLLASGIAPHRVRWMTPQTPADLLADSIPLDIAAAQASAAAAQAPLHLPRELLDMLQSAACFRAADRWAFLYCVLWRWRAGEREVMSIADPDGQRLRSMVKSVRREEHDMHAYVRFRERPPGAGAPRFVAWFEPSHDVLPQVARHFAKRMGSASWMIATPSATVLWDGNEVRFGAPLARNGALFDDAGEQLWLTYYASIFNPARLNTTVMHSHIPGRFWKNLPEGKIVPALVSDAANGGRRHGQAEGVSRQKGSAVKVSAEQAAPRRAQTDWPSRLGEDDGQEPAP